MFGPKSHHPCRVYPLYASYTRSMPRIPALCLVYPLYAAYTRSMPRIPALCHVNSLALPYKYVIV